MKSAIQKKNHMLACVRQAEILGFKFSDGVSLKTDTEIVETKLLRMHHEDYGFTGLVYEFEIDGKWLRKSGTCLVNPNKSNLHLSPIYKFINTTVNRLREVSKNNEKVAKVPPVVLAPIPPVMKGPDPTAPPLVVSTAIEPGEAIELKDAGSFPNLTPASGKVLGESLIRDGYTVKVTVHYS